MKVIFATDVPGQGKAGDIKDVSEGFARNYLLPRRLAIVATAGKTKEAELAAKMLAKRQARTQDELAKVAQQIEGKEVRFTAKAGKNERLYGAITNADIADKLSKVAEFTLDKRKVAIGEAIRTLGTHEVVIKLAKDIQATVKVTVEAQKE